MKQTFIKTLFILVCSVTLFKCDKEEIVAEQLNKIETVSINEALSVFPKTSVSNQFSKTTTNQFAVPNLDAITQEEIINSNELLTVIPATTYQGVYSRILVIKINDEIKSVVFSMVPDVAANTDEFSGMVYIHTLQKEYVNTFKVEDGIIVSRFKKPTVTGSSKSNFAKGDDDCWGITCGMRGEEVVIVAKNTKQFEFKWMFEDGGSDGDGSSGGYNGESWNSGSAGGGPDSNPNDNACDPGYVKDDNGNCVAENFDPGCDEGYHKDENDVCVLNPVYSAPCSAFEYAQPAGELVKACAVTGLWNRFYSYGIQNGKHGTFEAFVVYPLVFFTAPTWMTNGLASNKTATAVIVAFRKTDIWFAANPYATKEQVGNKLSSYILKEMAKFGGSMTQIPPFGIRSPAPYVPSLSGTGNCL
ncbi:MAG: hypothetical protein ACON5F_12725 [Jejuia sp.]